MPAFGRPIKPGVGDDLQLQDDPAFLPRRAGLELARGPVGGGGERLVALAAAAALGDGHLLAGLGQVAEDVAAVAVADDRAGRHVDDEVLGVAPWQLAAARRRRRCGPPVLAVDQAREVVGPGDGADDDGAAVAAVAAVRPALRARTSPAGSCSSRCRRRRL